MGSRHVVGLVGLLSLAGCASTRPARQAEASEVSEAARPRAPASEARATVVESKEGGFRVRFPFPAHEELSRQATRAGPLTLHTFMATDPGQRSAYYVSYTDFPEQAADEVDSREVLARASLGAVDSLGATDVTSHPVELDGLPGQEVVATAGDSALRGRFFLVGARLYQQLLIHPAGEVPPEAEGFFDSFQLDPETTRALGGSGRPVDPVRW